VRRASGAPRPDDARVGRNGGAQGRPANDRAVSLHADDPVPGTLTSRRA